MEINKPRSPEVRLAFDCQNPGGITVPARA